MKLKRNHGTITLSTRTNQVNQMVFVSRICISFSYSFIFFVFEHEKYIFNYMNTIIIVSLILKRKKLIKKKQLKIFFNQNFINKN